MNKVEILKVLELIENEENKDFVLKYKNKIEQTSEDELAKKCHQFNITDEDSLKKFFTEEMKPIHDTDEHIPINSIYSYGINGKSVHLHVIPKDIHSLFGNGKNKIKMLRGAGKMVYEMIDAIDNISNRKNNPNNTEFNQCDNLYMLSPIFLTPTMKKLKALEFFKKLGFDIEIFKGKDLENEEYLKNNSEARLADKIFGKEKTKSGHKKDVARLQISFEKINSKQWQTKKEFVKKSAQALMVKENRKDVKINDIEEQTY